EIALEVYPFQEWERQERRISEQSQFNAEVRKIGRLYISRAKEVELDGAGRILLPPDSRQHAGLVRDVTLVGPGRPFCEARGRSRARLAGFGDRVTLAHASFRDVAATAAAHEITRAESILLDLGVSSEQLQASGRGFSFQADEPLDMRLDPTTGPPATALLDRLPEPELTRVLTEYGDEPQARRIARAIVRRRPLRTTTDL